MGLPYFLSGEGGTIQEGKRFETALSPNHQMAIIQDTQQRRQMFGPFRKAHAEQLKDLLEQMRFGLDLFEGRFKVNAAGDLVDTQIYRKIENISGDDLAEMIILMDDLLSRME